MLETRIVERRKHSNHLADGIRVITHCGDTGLVGVGIGCAVEVVELRDSAINDGGEIGGEDGDATVIGSRLVDEVGVAVGDGEGEVVLGGPAGLGRVSERVISECLKLGKCDRWLLFIVNSRNDDGVGVDAIAVESVLDGADDAAELARRRG